MSAETAAQLNPHTGLPPLRYTAECWPVHFFPSMNHERRAKLKAQWERKDAEDCNQSHYKHYEWHLRSALEELEVREEQLRKAIAFLSPEQLETICPKPQEGGK